MVILTREVKHYTRWLHNSDQYRDTEIWLYRRTVYRLFGIAVWCWTTRKVHIPGMVLHARKVVQRTLSILLRVWRRRGLLRLDHRENTQHKVTRQRGLKSR